MTKAQKKSNPRQAQPAEAELVFVVDVSSFTKKGFVGTTVYEGTKLELQFDDLGEGLSLSTGMAGRLNVRKGSMVSVVVEDDPSQVSELPVSKIGGPARISDPRTYYALGREGGGILRLRA